MCQPTKCKQCGKTTWTGCGQHVEQVMRGVKPTDRCPGHEQPAPGSGFFSRLFGR